MREGHDGDGGHLGLAVAMTLSSHEGRGVLVLRVGLVLGVGRVAGRLWGCGVLGGALCEVVSEVMLSCMEFLQGSEGF